MASRFGIIPYRKDLKSRAQELRKNSTLSEVILWNELKGKSFSVKFHRQVPILNFIVDFYSHELKLAIEVDGSSHDYDKDVRRDMFLKRYGVTVLRIDDLMVKDDIEAVKNDIREVIVDLRKQ